MIAKSAAVLVNLALLYYYPGEKLQLLAEYCGDGRPGIVIGGPLEMLLNSFAVNDVLSINAKQLRDGETGGCLLS